MSQAPLGDRSRREPKPASAHTERANAAVKDALPFADRRSFENAARGFIASIDPPTIAHDHHPQPVFDLAPLGFLEQDAPATANPSLWRQAQLNARHHGLFEITDGLYQIRSLDLANMTLIRGDTGWIIIDPLTSSETSRAGLQLANEQLGERPVVAVIHTHSHVDHFAGVLGVVRAEQVASGEVQVIAPEHYVDESLSENVLAGNVMTRRASYMYGNLLPPSPSGFITCGLGAAVAIGSTGFVIPNDTVCRTGETRCVDGVEFEFQMTPGTEAPAEFVFYLPQFKALCMAEITSHHMHNVYTPRGAQVRDALAWSAQINESIDLFGDRLEIQFASHHWPIWGRDEALAYLKSQRDLYKYIHDQTLRLANHGYTMNEIAEQIRLPASLDQAFANRGYYGTLHHNARAVYVKYLGFFDGNPAHLFPLPPRESARRYLDYMGGADAVLTRARASFDEGDYRWVAEVLDHVVMAEPDHEGAKALLADTLEQLGYQAESGPWRNFFLSGALELRQGLPQTGTGFAASEGMARGMPLGNLFQTMAVRLNGPKAEGVALALDLDFTDLGEHWLLAIDNAVLHAFPNRRAESADAVLTLTSLDFKRLMMGLTTGPELIEAGRLDIAGDASALASLGALFDTFERRFPIVTPRPDPA